MLTNNSRSSQSVAVLTSFLIVVLAHVVFTWAHPSLFWGDVGRWLHEIDRFASGEVLYRDFYWPFPPLAVWVVGGLGRLLGSDLTMIWLITSTLFVGVFAAFYRFSSLLVAPRLLPMVLLSGFLLAVAHADRVGAPLPLGAYTPAAPLGFLLLLIAATLTLEYLEEHRSGQALAIGVLSGMCLLTKQDFWIPSLFLLMTVCVTAPKPLRWRRTLECFSAAAIVGLLGVSKIVLDTGWSELFGMLTGFGHVQEFGGLGLPTWETMTLEASIGAVLGLGVLGCFAFSAPDRRAVLSRWIVAFGAVAAVGIGVYVFMTYQVGERLLAEGLPAFPTEPEEFLWSRINAGGSSVRAGVALLRDRGLFHVPPVFFPVALLGLAVLNRSALRGTTAGRAAIMLLGLCVAARARRLFAGVDWFQFLLELPVYVSTIPVLLGIHGRQAKVALSLLLAAVLLGAGYSYWLFGTGPLTGSTETVRIETPRGAIHMIQRESEDLEFLRKAMDELDPGRTRPVFAFFYSGGMSYFLGRPNPAPITQGFRLSPWEPESVVAEILAGSAPPFLVDNRSIQYVGVPPTRLDLTRWDFRLQENHYMRVDRAYFEALTAACPSIVARKGQVERPFFTVYDCAPTWAPNPPSEAGTSKGFTCPPRKRSS